MKINDVASQSLIIFDIDDTLLHTTAQIRVIKNGRVVRTLNNQEFNGYELKPGEQFDFGEFRDAEKFRSESQPIRPMIAKLKSILNSAGNARVIMLTARADFDDKQKVLDTFARYGIDMSRVHIYRAGNLPGDAIPAEKKAVYVRRFLDSGQYNSVRLYDDSMSNLRVFKELAQEYPSVKFGAYYVGPSGRAVTVESQLEESSGYSLQGSWTPDLITSKIWVGHELEKITNNKPIPVAYILGSWYGNLAIVLRKMNLNIERLINVDQNKNWLAVGAQMADAMNIDGVHNMRANANRIDYRQLKDPGLVINTSLNDISDHGWFDHVPPGTLVVLQGRDMASKGAEHEFHSPDELLKLYPLEKVLYKGSMPLEDPETPYTRHMAIGIKGRDQIRELSFLGSPCTKDCSGHRAGYYWSAAKGGADAASWSPSFNKGAWLRRNGY